MPYLVRKLIKRDKLTDLPNIEDIETMNADIPTTEFRTTGGTLSTWCINSLEKLDEAVLAIAVTSSEISKLDVIVIDTSLLESNNLEYRQTYAGQDIIVPDLQDTHYDIINITVSKLTTCIKVYQSIFKMDPEEDTLIVRYPKGQVQDILKQAISNHRIKEDMASSSLKKELDKLKVR